ncbi:hypothetical protein N0V82_003626 [Gnomoniopsis sp. IMI 355080]|nr:hypothetical protein N0V82_003626 [Gnomoniopsis sp. IMI 355080]
MDDQKFWDLDPYNIETRGLPLRLDDGPLGVTMKTANIIIVVCSACALLVIPAVTCYMGITTFREGRRWRREEQEVDARRKTMERERQAARATKLATANAEAPQNELRLRGSKGNIQLLARSMVAPRHLVAKSLLAEESLSVAKSQSVVRSPVVVQILTLHPVQNPIVVECLVINKAIWKTPGLKIVKRPIVTTTAASPMVNNLAKDLAVNGVVTKSLCTERGVTNKYFSSSQRNREQSMTRRIEIWLDEAVLYEAQQNCASDKRHGHASDLLTSPSQRSIQTQTSSTSTICAVCGRYCKGAGPPMEASDGSGHSADPEARQNNSGSMFRGLKSAMTAFRSGNSEKRYDPALSTKMFSTSSADDDDNSDRSSSNFLPGSSDDNDNTKRVLDEKMARLKRAQKLLAKSASKQGKG